MTSKEIKAYYNTKPVEYVVSKSLSILEDKTYVPRFKLKQLNNIINVPINEPIKPTPEIIIKAIKYGMIFLVNYKGEHDNLLVGHERVIYPMVLGKSSVGKLLLRGYHLNGWSVSNNKNVDKIWRMFRVDRILSMTFTGSFYRLPPEGYNMNDKGMRGGIIAKADFSEIRRNQQTLVKKDEIQNKEEIDLDEKGMSTIKVKDTVSDLDLSKPMENPYINNLKDVANIRITFLKSLYGAKYFAILGALGKPGNIVKVMEGGKSLGVFRVMDSMAGKDIKMIKTVKGTTLYSLYVFEEKIG